MKCFNSLCVCHINDSHKNCNIESLEVNADNCKLAITTQNDVQPDVDVYIVGAIGSGKTLIRELLTEKLAALGATTVSNDLDSHSKEVLDKLKQSKVFSNKIVVIKN
jgi:polynucleotide 5'-kinase involved in rRNA processing